jgi:hypothetical protein
MDRCNEATWISTRLVFSVIYFITNALSTLGDSASNGKAEVHEKVELSTPLRHRLGVEVQLLSFLNWPLDGNEW